MCHSVGLSQSLPIPEDKLLQLCDTHKLHLHDLFSMRVRSPLHFHASRYICL